MEGHFSNRDMSQKRSCEEQSYSRLHALWAVVLLSRPFQSRPFIRGCTSSLCAAKGFLKGSILFRRISGQMICSYIHFVWKTLPGQWNMTRDNGLIWLATWDIACRVKTHYAFDIAAACSRPFIQWVWAYLIHGQLCGL